MTLRSLALVVGFASGLTLFGSVASAQERDPNRPPTGTARPGDVADVASGAPAVIPAPVPVGEHRVHRHDFINPDTEGHHRIQLSLGYAWDSDHVRRDRLGIGGGFQRRTQNGTVARTAIKFEYGYFVTDEVNVFASILADGGYRGQDRGNAIDLLVGTKFFLFHHDVHDEHFHRRSVVYEGDDAREGRDVRDNRDARHARAVREGRDDHDHDLARDDEHRHVHLDDYIQPFFGPQGGMAVRTYRETVGNRFTGALEKRSTSHVFAAAGGVIGFDFIVSERASFTIEYNFVAAFHGGWVDVRNAVIAGFNVYF